MYQIDTAAVLSVLTPLWSSKPETASRLRQRIEGVLDAAKAKGHRSGENPARWRGHLKHLLPKRSRLSKGHHAAMAYQDVPAFVQKLRGDQNTAALALEVCVLTAARSGEIYGARWSEVDLQAKVWTIPAAYAGLGRLHRKQDRRQRRATHSTGVAQAHGDRSASRQAESTAAEDRPQA